MLFYLFLQAVIYRWQQAVPQGMDVVKNILVFLNFAYTILVLNYSCVGFIVSTLSLSLSYACIYMNTCHLETLTYVDTCLFGHMYMNIFHSDAHVNEHMLFYDAFKLSHASVLHVTGIKSP